MGRIQTVKMRFLWSIKKQSRRVKRYENCVNLRIQWSECR